MEMFPSCIEYRLNMICCRRCGGEYTGQNKVPTYLSEGIDNICFNCWYTVRDHFDELFKLFKISLDKKDKFLKAGPAGYASHNIMDHITLLVKTSKFNESLYVCTKDLEVTRCDFNYVLRRLETHEFVIKFGDDSKDKEFEIELGFPSKQYIAFTLDDRGGDYNILSVVKWPKIIYNPELMFYRCWNLCSIPKEKPFIIENPEVDYRKTMFLNTSLKLEGTWASDCRVED